MRLGSTLSNSPTIRNKDEAAICEGLQRLVSGTFLQFALCPAAVSFEYTIYIPTSTWLEAPHCMLYPQILFKILIKGHEIQAINNTREDVGESALFQCAREHIKTRGRWRLGKGLKIAWPSAVECINHIGAYFFQSPPQKVCARWGNIYVFFVQKILGICKEGGKDTADFKKDFRVWFSLEFWIGYMEFQNYFLVFERMTLYMASGQTRSKVETLIQVATT